MTSTRLLWDEDLAMTDGVEELLPEPTVIDTLPLHREIQDGELFIFRNSESRYLSHLFHKYAGKFIPHVPRWALYRYLPRNAGMIVLDPFVGSGTTLVEACLHGQHGFGVDVDPLARLISKVKTTPIPEPRLRRLPTEVAAILESTNEGTYCPSIPTLSHWFTTAAVNDLSAILHVVSQFHEEPDVYDFLLVCFSSIIRRASNADNQTMKTYVSHTNPKHPEPARPLFLKTVHTYADRLSKFMALSPSHASATILEANDARTLDAVWRDLQLPDVDVAITSPPYIKSVDYIYNQMVELFWIGDRWGLENQEKQNTFKRRYVGHDRPAAQASATLHTTGVAPVDDYISRVFERNRSLALVMWRYFSDMSKHFAEMKSILRPGAHYIVVVGDSTLASVMVPTHALLQACAEEYGFAMPSSFAYEIRNKYMHFPRAGRGGEVALDWVLDFVSI